MEKVVSHASKRQKKMFPKIHFFFPKKIFLVKFFSFFSTFHFFKKSHMEKVVPHAPKSPKKVFPKTHFFSL